MYFTQECLWQIMICCSPSHFRAHLICLPMDNLSPNYVHSPIALVLQDDFRPESESLINYFVFHIKQRKRDTNRFPFHLKMFWKKKKFPPSTLCSQENILPFKLSTYVQKMEVAENMCITRKPDSALMMMRMPAVVVLCLTMDAGWMISGRCSEDEERAIQWPRWNESASEKPRGSRSTWNFQKQNEFFRWLAIRAFSYSALYCWGQNRRSIDAAVWCWGNGHNSEFIIILAVIIQKCESRIDVTGGFDSEEVASSRNF